MVWKCICMSIIKKVDYNKEYDENVLKHLHDVELKMLNDFIEICNNHNLTYFLHAGTALGAIRHKGFIPWDDEIDVLMPREDYEKFLNIFDEKNSNYYLINWNTTLNISSEYLTHKSLFCLKNTKIPHPLWNMGIYIDISVLDKVPNNNFKKRIFKKKIYFYYFFMNFFEIIKADKYISKNKGQCQLVD